MANTYIIGDIRGVLKFRSKAPSYEPSEQTPTTTYSISNRSPDSAFSNSNTKSSKKPSSTYTLDDFIWSEFFQISKVSDYSSSLSTNVPKLILTEFQPLKAYNTGRIAIEAIGGAFAGTEKALAGLNGGFGGNGIGGVISSSVGAALSSSLKNAIDPYIYHSLMKYYGENKDAIIGEVVEYIRNLFTGQFLSAYEVPFFGREFLESSTGTWSTTGNQPNIEGAIGKAIQQGTSFNIPVPPTWTVEGASRYKIANTFFLINDSPTSILKNFRFLHSLISGTFWAQIYTTQASPNLYDVLCPGRFHRMFCSLTMTVEYAGKTRKCPDAISKIKDSTNITFLREDQVFFPDAYNVTMAFDDLTPNNFNLYAATLMADQDVQVRDSRTFKNDIGYLKQPLLKPVMLDILAEGERQIEKVPGLAGAAAKEISNKLGEFVNSWYKK